ncbi:hypothetical protein SB861_64705, partial [Paraburkholderia sp. SIMBA_049]
LVAASAVLISEASNRTAIQWGITAACAVLAWSTRIHPLWLLAAGALIAAAPVAAWAHGKLESATPATGSTVDTAPDTLRLAFNED